MKRTLTTVVVLGLSFPCTQKSDSLPVFTSSMQLQSTSPWRSLGFPLWAAGYPVRHVLQLGN